MERAGEIAPLLKYMSIWSSLKRANADMYFHSAGATGVLPLFCFMNRKNFIHRIASDAVVLGKLEFVHRAEQRKPVDIVVYELASWRAKKGTSSRVREMALRLSGVLSEHLWYLESIGVEIVRVTPEEWQRSVFGDKYNSKMPSAERKKLSMEYCRELGYEPENHHIADSVNICYYIVGRG